MLSLTCQLSKNHCPVRLDWLVMLIRLKFGYSLSFQSMRDLLLNLRWLTALTYFNSSKFKLMLIQVMMYLKLHVYPQVSLVY